MTRVQPTALAGGLAHPVGALADGVRPVRDPDAGEARVIDAGGLPVAFPLLPPGIRQLLYTPEQAAVLLTLRPSWLRRAAAEGEVACTYLGKHLRFSEDDLRAIIADNSFGPRPE